MRRVLDAGKHARDLIDTGIVEQHVRPGDSTPLCLFLGHGEVRVRERRDLGEMRDTEHLVMTCEVRQGAPHGGSRLTADPGVHLVEHQCRRRFREDHTEREHRA